MELPQLIRESDALHRRVQQFAAGAREHSFEQLATSIARFQAQASPNFAKLVRARAASLSGVDDIPAVPAEAFRLTRVAVHPAELDRVRFVTSGTTGLDRGIHAMRRTDTYEQLSLRFGREALLPVEHAPAGGQAVVVALAPEPPEPPSSSLGYMMARFMEAFDEPVPRRRWLLGAAGVDLEGLQRACEAARAARRPLLVLTTAFALVRLLDDLQGEKLALPRNSVVMQTGGFKGRTREVSAEQLRRDASSCFALDPNRIVGEYGMTELTSQLYESTIAESALAQSAQPGAERAYVEPPWLRVTPLDPANLEPVADGQIGVARFVDLGNVDSAVSIVTEDRVRRVAGGIELLGRQPSAPARGCSLALEALLGG